MDPKCPNGHEFSMNAKVGSPRQQQIVLLSGRFVDLYPIHCFLCGHVFSVLAEPAE